MSTGFQGRMEGTREAAEPAASTQHASGWTEENLVFIFSLPRSGSTLLQRLLATHSAVATTAESWLLLPLVYALRSRGALAEYGHRAAAGALEDFLRRVPRGDSAYLEAVKRLAVEMYAAAAPAGARLFVEKTPRNALIADEILRTFTGSRHIVLWRNPLAVAASMIESFGDGRWNLYKYRIDLHAGLESLVAAAEAYGDRICSVRYEDLAASPEATCARVFHHVGLEFEPRLLAELTRVELPGRMGDVGRNEATVVTDASLDHWRAVLCNPFRRRWARGYLDWIGAERLALMGYDAAELRAQLEAAPVSAKRLLSDLPRAAYGVLDRVLELDVLRRKWSTAGGASIGRHA
jgi:hypothetical protein